MPFSIPYLPRQYRTQSVFMLSVLFFALIGLAQLSRLFTINELPMSAIWPGTGIMLAAALSLGLRSLWVTMTAVFLWLVLLQDSPLLLALVSTAGQGCGAALACWLLQRNWQHIGSSRPLALQLSLFTRGALAGGVLSAMIGALGYTWLMPGFSKFHYLDIWLVYWSFEAVSVILFVPLTYFILHAPSRFIAQLNEDWQRPGMKVWLGAITLLLIAAWSSSLYADSPYSAAIGFAFFPALCWLVLQTRGATVALAIPLFSALFVAFYLHGWAGLPVISEVPDLIRALLLVGGLAVIGQMIAAITAERMLLLREFKQQAGSDYLTGLNNDRALSSQLQKLLRQKLSPTGPRDTPAVQWLCLLEVLHYDQIEDLLGFQGSQHLEKLLAARLMGTVGPDARPTRIGGGSYAFTLQPASNESLQQTLDTVYQAFNNQHFVAGDHHNQLRTCLGAVPLDGSLQDHSHYLSAAAQAALLARQQVHRVRIIDDTRELMNQRRQLTDRLEVLQSALSDERLELFAQIIQPLANTDEQLSFEILLRLRDPQGNLISPADFLPVAETFGFMLEIDRWVIRNTLDALAANPGWMARTRKCAINLAGSSLSSGELVGYIHEQLERTGIPAHFLCFEITETQSIPSRESAVALIRQLRALGCSVSLDDFGTGLATFDYLRSFELDFLKIDGVFIRELEHSPHDRSMVRAICNVARDMGLKTVAEFVEGESVVALLRELGVDYGQGYGLGRPQPLAQLFNG